LNAAAPGRYLPKPCGRTTTVPRLFPASTASWALAVSASENVAAMRCSLGPSRSQRVMSTIACRRAAAGALFSTTPRRFTFFRISVAETGIAGATPPRDA
jgi:hypothetical protein